MILSTSPYAIFKADEWVTKVAQTIGIVQCLRLMPKKFTAIRSSFSKENSQFTKTVFSDTQLQPALA